MLGVDMFVAFFTCWYRKDVGDPTKKLGHQYPHQRKYHSKVGGHSKAGGRCKKENGLVPRGILRECVRPTPAQSHSLILKYL
jgi:hypothetical protein